MSIVLPALKISLTPDETPLMPSKDGFRYYIEARRGKAALLRNVMGSYHTVREIPWSSLREFLGFNPEPSFGPLEVRVEEE